MVLLPERNLSIDGVCARGCWGTSEQITRRNNAPECAIRTESHHPRLLLLLRRTWHSSTREIPLRWHRFILWLASCLSCSARWMRPSIHPSFLTSPAPSSSFQFAVLRRTMKKTSPRFPVSSILCHLESLAVCLSVCYLRFQLRESEFRHSVDEQDEGVEYCGSANAAFLKEILWATSSCLYFLYKRKIGLLRNCEEEEWEEDAPRSDRHTRKCDGGG